jgi:hypothetical protein
MKVTLVYFSLIILLSAELIDAQKVIDASKLFSSFAKKENREKEKLKLKNELERIFALPKNETNEKEWIKFLEVSELYFIKSDKILEQIKIDFIDWEKRSLKYRRAVLKYIAANYRTSFLKDLKTIFNTTTDPEIFAITANLLTSDENQVIFGEEIKAQIKTRFSDSEDNPILLMLTKEIEKNKNSANLPALADLLKNKFQDDATIIYSFFRNNRKLPGLSVIKGPDGKFIRDENDEIIGINQLACSATNLPSFIPGGNTPQGVYSIVGWYITPTESIGPTPIILTRIPFEKPTSTFYHNKHTSNSWRLEDYNNLLPKTWQKYFPIKESFYAGKIGRKLIVMHGSVDDLDYYKDQPYYPLTPSRGCITAKEIWSETNGKCLESGQARLANAFFSTKNLKGFLVVIEIDNKNSSVVLDDILEYCIEAEK